MFLQNDVLEYAGAPRRAIRILWIDPDRCHAFVFELGQGKAVPRQVRLEALAADVQARRARLLLHDPYAVSAPEGAAGRHRALQLKAWTVVASLQRDLPALYDQRRRAALVAGCAAAFGISRASVMRYLRRYWERGQTEDALLPDYVNSGAPGKTRAPTAGVKRGRPRKSAVPGPNVDDAMRATFRSAASRYAALHGRLALRPAYLQMLADFFAHAEPPQIPSLGQFNYWVVRDGLKAAPRATAQDDPAAPAA